MSTTPRRTAYAASTDPHQKQWAKHPTGLCGVPGCTRKHFTHDMCNMHWLRWRREHQDVHESEDPLKPEPTLKEDKRWRPEWKQRSPKKLKAVRKEARAKAEKSAVVWETSAANRAASLIAKRRFILASILERLGDPFALFQSGPSATLLQKVGEDTQFSVPTLDWETLNKAGWIGSTDAGATYTATALGNEQVQKYKDGPK